MWQVIGPFRVPHFASEPLMDLSLYGPCRANRGLLRHSGTQAFCQALPQCAFSHWRPKGDRNVQELPVACVLSAPRAKNALCDLAAAKVIKKQPMACQIGFKEAGRGC